jgi:uncharacterized membrane protein
MAGTQNHIVAGNIAVLRDLRRRDLRQRTRQQRIADAITGFAGSMNSVYLHAALFGGWLLVNSGVVAPQLVFDPYPFVMLAMLASVEAIFLSTFVLVSQNRQAELEARQNELELQINLLAERELTKLIAVVDDVARHLGVATHQHDTDPLKEDVTPNQVLEQIERAQRDSSVPPQ